MNKVFREAVCSQVWYGYPLQRGFLFGQDNKGLWIYPSLEKPKNSLNIPVMRISKNGAWRWNDAKGKPYCVYTAFDEVAKLILRHFAKTHVKGRTAEVKRKMLQDSHKYECKLPELRLSNQTQPGGGYTPYENLYGRGMMHDNR